MFKVIYASIPPLDYNINDHVLIESHTLCIKTLHKFMKGSQVLLSKFVPPDYVVNKLQIAKLIKSNDKNAHLAAVEFSSFLIANCRVVLPIKLVSHD